MKNIRKALALVLALAMSLSLSISAAAVVKDDSKVVILHTNDVHCGIDHIVTDGVVTRAGYSGLMAVKTEAEEAYGKDNVILVDCGDSIQGESIGTLTKGEALVDLMNQLGYTFAAPGNHEFDWGVDNFAERVKQAQYTYLCCNLTDLRTGKPLFDGYRVVEINGVKVGFVGIDTPETFFKSTPTYFKDENGKYIYSFSEGNNGKDLYDAVQKAVDAARAEGAQYVVALAHLGIKSSSEEWKSSTVIANTTGIDVMLDGHSHEAWTQEVANKNGETVLLQQTGTKLTNVGKVTIDVKTGKIEGELIPAASCTTEDAGIAAAVQAENDEFAEILNRVVARSEVLLNVYDPETGARLIRNTETNLANLVADAYLSALDADVSFVNGGGIRADIAAGDVTFNDIIKVHPYGNQGCVAEVTGQTILDALELGVANYPDQSGGFPHVAGMSYTIDARIPSSVVKNDNGEFVEITGERRIKDVMIGDQPLDPAKTYRLASTDYYLKNAGDGYTMLVGHKLLQDGGILDNEILINYIVDKLGGVVTAEKYGEPQGRITIIPDPLSAFSDVDVTLWYAPALRFAVSEGIMNGTGDGAFKPDNTTTRAEVVTMLWRLVGSPAYVGMSTYSDVAGDEWYGRAVRWADAEGIVTGYNGKFNPGGAITREELATMLYRFEKEIKNGGFTGMWQFQLQNPDAAKVSSWADEAVKWMVMNKVINGVDAAGTLLPQGNATRAAIAQMFLNYSKLSESGERTLALGQSGYYITVPASYKAGAVSAEDAADDQIAYYASEEYGLDFDVYELAKEDTLAAYAAAEAKEYGATAQTRTINGTTVAYYEATEQDGGKSYQTLTYLFDAGDNFVEIVFWLDGSDASALAERIISSLTGEASQKLALGQSGYYITVPASYKAGTVSAEDAADDQIAYYASEEYGLDFDVYELAKEDTLATYAAAEAKEYGATAQTRTINGTTVAYYEATEQDGGKSYQTLSYLFDAGDNFVEIVFWLDGSDASALAESIISSLTGEASQKLALGQSGYTITVPASYKAGAMSAEDAADDQIAYYASENYGLDFDVYELAKGDDANLADYAMKEANQYNAELKTRTVGGTTVAYYEAVEQDGGKDYNAVTYIFESGDEYVEIVFWLDGSDASALAESIISSLTK